MNIKYLLYSIVSIIIVIVILFKASIFAKASPEQFIKDTKFKLVAEYKPAHIYIYVDTTSTNEMDNYLVSQGNIPVPVVLRETTSSNTVEVTHFEKGLGILTTIYNSDGQILKRSLDVHASNSAQLVCSYISTNNDGLWDYFLQYGKRTTVFVRNNLCWVPISKRESK